MTQAADLISDDYRKLNADMHQGREDWGTTGSQWGASVQRLATALKTQDVLDYGCGKGALSQAMPFPIRQYDPAIAQYSSLPAPAKVVTCLDVLEHIEPDRIDGVLAHLATLVTGAGFFVIHLRAALNTLPDGRNAHLLVRHPTWWMRKLLAHFDIQELNVIPPHLVVLVKPLTPSEPA